MWFLHALFVLLAATGIFLLLLAARNLVQGNASRRWPEVPGRILRSFVLVDKGDDGGDGFTPKVEYEYTVSGSPFRGTRLRYGQTGSWNREHAERILARFPANSGVMVFVDPNNPSNSVLIRGTSKGNLVIALAGLILFGAAFLFWVRGE